jgi:hypothetical protein
MTDPLERVYTHHSSQETLFDKREHHAEALRNIYRHPRSQEILTFPDSKPALRELTDLEKAGDKLYDSPAWKEAQAKSRAAEGVRDPQAPRPAETPKPAQPAKAAEPAATQEALKAEGTTKYAEALSGYDEQIAEAEESGNADQIAFLRAAKAEAGKVLADFGVTAADAKAVADVLSEYDEPLDAAQLAQLESETTTYLRWMWGDQMEAKLAAAKAAADAACARLPWLRQVLAAGAGNDARVIQRFAALGNSVIRR